ncbi:hypothetical protein [Clostridium weizhouense]|uniref:Uncharacterized protein n=1 Tax=Clostridium weizhouense TaxID=2859781 RepID=A0ABS7AV44_9CLOT|nr:hypothetical protein [Clostridium weizhouense]MBW6411675.1 hypothetical protein [Clostridium weizhouense]
MNDISIDLKETLHKEIDLIQACILRMSQNSFQLKGWLVSLIAVILAVTAKSTNVIFINILLIVITFTFWCLNAYFLRTERLYRKLYDWVITERLNNNIDFLYNLNAHRFEMEVGSILKTMFLKTLVCFYGTTFVLLIIILSYNLIPIIHYLLCPYK